MKMRFPLPKHPQGGFEIARHQANNSQKTFSYGPGCSKESWEILNHSKKLEVDGPQGENQCYYRAGDAICTNRQKHDALIKNINVQ